MPDNRSLIEQYAPRQFGWHPWDSESRQSFEKWLPNQPVEQVFEGIVDMTGAGRVVLRHHPNAASDASRWSVETTRWPTGDGSAETLEAFGSSIAEAVQSLLQRAPA